MRIFQAFLTIVVVSLLFMLPFTDAVYDFQTDLREDTFTVPTAAGVTTANLTLFKPIYDDDISTLSYLSNLSTDVPIFSSYNTTSRLLVVSGLTANTTRTFDVSYDVDALEASTAINNIIEKVPFFWLLCVIALPVCALVALFINRT